MKNLIGIHAVNSVDFVKKTFYCFNKRIPFAIVKKNTSFETDFEYQKFITPNNHGGWLDVQQPTISDNTPAQIVYTSGTEGKPKTILLNHNTLENTVTRLNKIMEVDDTIREYIGVPVYYSFGLGRCRAVCAAGGKAFIPEKGFNPLEIATLLKKGSINAISAVPTLWRMILDNEKIIGNLGSKVKWIEIGSQFMSVDEKEKMIHLFPNAMIVQHYGLTEASRSTFLILNKVARQQLNSVGQSVLGAEVKISSDNRIMIRGDHVADGIIENKKIKSLTDTDSWLTTNDLGHIEEDYLYYDGRVDDIINCGGIKVDPETIQNQLENSLNTNNQIALSKYLCPIRGEGFLIAKLNTCNIEDDTLIGELSTTLKNYSINTNSSIKLIRLESFPVTSTGKIQRKEITKLFQSQKTTYAEPITEKHNNYLFQQFATVFPTIEIKPKSTFSGLGGDSLNYVQISMSLEEYLGFLPQDWENQEIGNLVKLKPVKKQFFSEIESSIVLRVIAIFAVVLTHSDFVYAGGGTYLLFMLIGYNMGRFKHNEFTQSGLWNWFSTYAIKILIPYALLAAIFMLYIKEFEISTVFLVTNLIKLKLTTIFPFWFVQVLLQSLLMLSILFSLILVREKLKIHPWESSLFILSALVLIRFTYPVLWDTDYLRNLVPQRFIMIIWLGYCFNFATNINRKVFLFITGTMITCFDVSFKFTLHWLITGSFILAFFPYFKVPSFSKKLLYLIANSTFYIFIFNGLVLLVLAKISPVDSRVVLSLLTMITCVIMWKISSLIDIEKKMLDFVHRISGRSK